MRRITFTLAALALVASCLTLRTTHAFAAHGTGSHQTAPKNSGANDHAGFTASTYTITSTVEGGFLHTYTLGTNPFCSTGLTGTGQTPSDSYYFTNETVTGAFDGTTLTYTSTYSGPWAPGYSYSVTATATPTGTNSYSFTGTTDSGLAVTGTIMGGTSTYKNKGQYVSSLSDTQKAAFESACGTTTTSDDDQDTDSDEGTGTESD